MTAAQHHKATTDFPLDAPLHRQLSAQQHQQGDELAALAHLIAAKAIEAWHEGANNHSAWELYLVATGYFMKGDYDVAERWYRLVLKLDANIAEAYQNLVVIHAHAGRHAEAEACRATAYRLQRVFIDPILEPVRQLLILCAGRTSGNIPYEFLLSAERSRRIKYIIDYADETEDRNLPPFDLVFNAIGEPDAAARLEPRIARFLQQCDRPVMNRPQQVSRTQRHMLPALLDGIAGVQTAPCRRLDVPADHAAQPDVLLCETGMSYPVLLRPLATHGGEGLVRCADSTDLADALRDHREACYLSQFVDVQSADGFFRKYRVIFVDRQPFPYHLAISPHWMSHYYTADMLDHDWKIAEERQFLQDPAAILREAGMTALRSIGAQMDLEFCGVDFTVLPDGSLFVFEANASMLVHRVSNSGPVAHKNGTVQKIADAFEAMQARLEKTV